jgi:outer membrane receptor protein involved in Fe transport
MGTSIDQITRGGAIQFNWNLEHHKFMAGLSYDSSKAEYGSTSQLALMDASHNVYLDPENIDPLYYAAFNPITNNAFEGTSRTASLYFSETWTPVEEWNFSASARYNKTKVMNDLKSRTTAGFSELHNIRQFMPNFILCPTNDPASCPDGPNASSVTGYSSSFPNRAAQFEQGGHKEKFSYYSLNPSLGATFSPNDNLNMYVNWNQGTRAPSVIELGCAFDRKAPFSGGACTLPSTLSGDPYLPQIKATTHEAGLRGMLPNGWRWNTSVYQTDLKDDVYFVGFTPSRSYFDTIGDTRRQGLEFGLSGSVGKADFSLSYGLTSATFETPFWLSNIANSSTDRDINAGNGAGAYPYEFDCCGGGQVVMPQNPEYLTNNGLPTYRLFKVNPGSRMSGIPLHNLNFAFNYRATERWNIGFRMIARSSAFARGNENNKHRAGPGTPEDGPLICDEPIFDNDGNFTGNFNCVSQPAFFRATQPYLNDGKTPGYAIVNFETSYKLDKGLTLGLLINNIFDKEFFSGSRLGVTPFSPSIYGAVGPSGFNYNSKDWQNTNFVAPGAPRAAWLTLTYDFDEGK